MNKGGQNGPLSAAEYCELIIRFIADQMLDPHRYFEQKLVGELRGVGDDRALTELISRLVGWVRGGLLEPAQRRRLDEHLAARGGPTASLWAGEPELARLLLAGGLDDAARRRLAARLQQPGLDEADRRLLTARVGGG